jgi:MFS family permease
MVAALTLVGIVAGVDRHCLSLLAPLIKRDLALTDAEVSLLVGLSFTLFNTLMALPAGWLLDRYNRKRLTFVGAVLWSAATTACGFASSFNQLFVGRAGTGFAEGGLTPAAFSLIRDTMAPASRGRAFAFFSASAGLSASVAMLVGGALVAAVGQDRSLALPLVGEMRAWQVTLVAIGLGGLPFALLLIPIVEPPRAAVEGQPKVGGYREALDYMAARRRLFLPLLMFGALFMAMSSAAVAWMPSVVNRSYGMSVSNIGFSMAVILAVFPPAGVLASGFVIDRLVGRGRPDTPATVGVALTLAVLVPILGMPLAPSIGWFWGFMAAFYFLAGMYLPVWQTLLARLAPASGSGKASALFAFIFALVGGGIAPVAVGAMADRLFGGPHALGQALAAWSLVTVAGACAAVWLLKVRLKGYEDPA